MTQKIIAAALGLMSLIALTTPAFAQQIPAGYALVPISSLGQSATPAAPIVQQNVHISQEYSTVRASDNIVFVGESTRVTVVLRDSTGAALHGRNVLLTGSRGIEQISGSGITNANGEAVFSVLAKKEGVSTFTAIDQASGTQLGARPRVVFLKNTALGGDENLLGASVLGASALDSTPATAPTIFIQPQFATAEMRTQQPGSLTVYITDIDGNLIEDFTGTVSFASSDAGARLPAAHTFSADQRGMHTFYNAVTFATAGEQRVTVSTTTPGVQEGTATVQVRGAGSTTNAPTIQNPYDGMIARGTVPVTGSANPLTNIAILANGSIISSGESDASGAFSVEIQLDDGTHEITAATLRDGRQIDVVSEAVTIEIDNTPPVFQQVQFDPAGTLAPNTLSTARVSAEAGLATVQLTVGRESFLLFEVGDGVYEGEVKIAAEGDHLVGVFLRDMAGNETRVEDAAALRVADEMPENIALTVEPGNATALLEWPAPEHFTEIAYYIIRYGTSRDVIRESLTTPDAGLAWHVDELQNNTQYFFLVESYDEHDRQNGTSAVVAATPRSLIDLVATPCATGISLAWQAAEDPAVVRYEIVYGIRPGVYTEREAVFAGTSHTLRNLIAGVTYYVSVRGLDARGAAVFDPGEERAVTVGGGACHFAATSEREYSITLHKRVDAAGKTFLSWNPIPDAASYRVYAGTAPNTFDLPAVSVTTPYFRPTGLREDVEYFFSVKAVLADGQETKLFSNVVGLEVGPPLAVALALMAAFGGAGLTLRRKKK